VEIIMKVKEIVQDWLSKYGYKGLLHRSGTCRCVGDDVLLCLHNGGAGHCLPTNEEGTINPVSFVRKFKELKVGDFFTSSVTFGFVEQEDVFCVRCMGRYGGLADSFRPGVELKFDTDDVVYPVHITCEVGVKP
jgi:hypothetical protein